MSHNPESWPVNIDGQGGSPEDTMALTPIQPALHEGQWGSPVEHDESIAGLSALPSLRPEVPVDPNAPGLRRTDSMLRVGRFLTSRTGVACVALAAGIVIGVMSHENVGPFQKEEEPRDYAAPEQPGMTASPSSEASATASASHAAPSATKQEAAAAKPSRTAGASASTSATASPSASVSAGVTASASASASAPETQPTQPADTDCDPAPGTIVACGESTNAGSMVGYNNLRDMKIIWNLYDGMVVTPECVQGGYMLVDSEEQPVGRQAAYVPLSVLKGATAGVADCN